MTTTTSKGKAPETKHGFARTTSLPPPYQLAIEDTAFQMTVLGEHIPRDYDGDCTLVPPAWFAVTLMASTKKRFLYLVQKETGTGMVVLLLLYDRLATPATATDDTEGLRVPQSGAWLRAIVEGTVYVLASDLVLNHKSITAWIGGHEPPTTPAKPPYT
ncbi:MAG TPA: hypothetical protein VHN14_22405 [Kofleriaceae bacterium]|jgi:hypothetical protein|nr:hypothetical protein [Kofleriaceae bacterium]